MLKCREKVPVVEAYHHDLEHELPEWLLSALCVKQVKLRRDSSLAIRTSTGEMHASVGDWIVRCPKGELHPYTPDSFARTYETVENC